MLELYHGEPNTFSLKSLIALGEKQAAFKSYSVDVESPVAAAAIGCSGTMSADAAEAASQLEHNAPVLVADGHAIVGTFFMLEYLAESLPGPTLLPESATDRYAARALGQYLGASLGAIVPVLGCVKYLLPKLQARNRAQLQAEIDSIALLERRMGWNALLDGTYSAANLEAARERLTAPIQRVEQRLKSHSWLAGVSYSIADIDAFCMLRVLPDLVPATLNQAIAPATMAWLQRIERRTAVTAALMFARTAHPEQQFAPGLEASRWG
jgi:glutathione S-transferase